MNNIQLFQSSNPFYVEFASVLKNWNLLQREEQSKKNASRSPVK